MGHDSRIPYEIFFGGCGPMWAKGKINDEEPITNTAQETTDGSHSKNY